MAGVTLKGMTWDHRRAIDPLIATMPAFRARHPDIDIAWSTRSLSGFEFTSLEALAATYDLIILDHPHGGAIARSRCLLPVDDILAPGEDPFVGPSLDSYRHDGALWALPVDAACQVAVSRPDLMAAADARTPRSWAEVLALGARLAPRGVRLAIGFAGVHSLMTFFSLMAGAGAACATTRDRPLAERSAARQVLGEMRALLAYCPPQSLDWNSIALHEEMSRCSDLAYCPAVYCYATYAEADRAHPLRFHAFPGPAGPRGSTLGGTGLGLSANCQHPGAGRAYLRFCAEEATQRAFALHHGQPAHHGPWEDPAIDQRFGGCYGETRETMEKTWIRPCYDGYIGFQEQAGPLVEAHLRGDLGADTLLDRLERLHAGDAGRV